jgi:hypothetical protein
MATFTLTYFPILYTLQHSGEVKFSILAQELIRDFPKRFRDIYDVERAIDDYCCCLFIKDGFVVYNKTSKRYGYLEGPNRDTEIALIEDFPNFGQYKLRAYPYRE